MEAMIIFLIIVCFGLSAICIYKGIIIKAERSNNIDIQKENYDLIDRNLKLDKANTAIAKDMIKLIDKIRKKKELLEIQDKLLDENNIKH